MNNNRRGLAAIVMASRRPAPAPRVLPFWLMATFYALGSLGAALAIWEML